MCHENSLKSIIPHHKPLTISNPTIEVKSTFPVTVTNKGIPGNSLEDICTYEPLLEEHSNNRLSERDKRMQWVETDSLFLPGNDYLFFSGSEVKIC